MKNSTSTKVYKHCLWRINTDENYYFRKRKNGKTYKIALKTKNQTETLAKVKELYHQYIEPRDLIEAPSKEMVVKREGIKL